MPQEDGKHWCLHVATCTSITRSETLKGAEVTAPPRHSASDFANEAVAIKRLQDEKMALNDAAGLKRVLGIVIIDDSYCLPPAELPPNEVVWGFKTATPSLTNADATVHASTKTNQWKSLHRDICSKKSLQT